MTSSPMHIALVIERFDPFAGGAERSTAQIAAELVRRGHQVTVLTGWCNRPDALEGVTVVTGPFRANTSVELVLFSRWARRQLEQGPYDTSLSVTMAVPAAVLQPRGGTVRETLDRNIALRNRAFDRGLKRTLVHLTPKYLAQLAIERRTLNDPMVRRVVAVSQYVIDQLQTHYVIPDEKIELIPNAAVMPQVDAAKKQAWREAVRSAFAIPDSATAYLFAAKNPGLKGFEPLLQAVRHLEGQGVEPVLLLAGEFWFREHRRVCQLDLRDKVRFIRQTRQMGPLFAASDVTVLPSFYDPCSKVVIESLMMGVPAISSGYNGASDFIVSRFPDQGEAGAVRGRVVAEPWDVAGLADAMAALADPAERARCAAATAGLDEQLTMARHVDRLEAVLRAAAYEQARIMPPIEQAAASPE